MNEEAERENAPAPEGPELRSPFWKKVENYWYHYKWPTIIGLFVLAATLIVVLQMCTTPKYDLLFTYAGPTSPTAAQKTNMQASLSAVVSEGEETPKTAVISCYYIAMSDGGGSSLLEEGILQNASRSNWDAFNDEVLSGQTILCLLSPEMYRSLSRHVNLLPLSTLCPELDREWYHQTVSETGVVTYDDYAVQLKKTDFGKLPGFASLPDDTLLCMTDLTATGAWFSRGDYVKKHEEYRAVMTAILTYRAPEE